METTQAEIYAGFGTYDDEVATAILFIEIRKESRPGRMVDKNGVHQDAAGRVII
jgi:hypothetical protein